MRPEWIIVPVVVVAFLAWTLIKRFRVDRMHAFNEARRKTCRLVGTGELINGRQHLPVALAVSDSTFYYENEDLAASLDLARVQEVEYENELVTGQPVAHGKVLRLRSANTVLEFVVDNTSVPQWQAVLPSARVHARS